MTESGNGYFERLAEGFSPEQRSEFFQVLHETDITAHDVELARLLRVLQLYKAYYESIPSAVVLLAIDIRNTCPRRHCTASIRSKLPESVFGISLQSTSCRNVAGIFFSRSASCGACPIC